jgi:hypothetical protein
MAAIAILISLGGIIRVSSGYAGVAGRVPLFQATCRFSGSFAHSRSIQRAGANSRWAVLRPAYATPPRLAAPALAGSASGCPRLAALLFEFLPPPIPLTNVETVPSPVLRARYRARPRCGLGHWRLSRARGCSNQTVHGLPTVGEYYSRIWDLDGLPQWSLEARCE